MPSPRSQDARPRRTDGERTHATILEKAVDVASIEGINGMTVGRLAEALGVSKSGLYAHFGSKEQLQLETIEAAWAIFEREVLAPTLDAPEGVRQLEAMLDAFFSYVERDVFPGGCFFASLLAEEDARTGPIHEVVVSSERETIDGIAAMVGAAQQRAEIAADVDAAQLAYEVYSFMELANFHFVLFRDPEVLERGRRAAARALEAARPVPADRPRADGRRRHV
ncbi:MAG: TetR/AcrR family transcriptional regulator [Actinomycetota bacterium]